MELLRGLLKDWRVWVILVAGLIMWLSSCTQPEYLDPPLKKYTVQQGKHDFLPNPTLLPGEARDFDGVITFHESMWYDNLGVDNADWNKLFGVYRYFDFKKNQNAFILAWRPDLKIRGAFDLILYENIAGANAPKESAFIKVRSGEQFRFTLSEINGVYSLYINGNLVGTQQNERAFKTIGIVSAWFGGNRTAPHMMWFWMNIL